MLFPCYLRRQVTQRKPLNYPFPQHVVGQVAQRKLVNYPFPQRVVATDITIMMAYKLMVNSAIQAPLLRSSLLHRSSVLHRPSLFLQPSYQRAASFRTVYSGSTKGSQSSERDNKTSAERDDKKSAERDEKNWFSKVIGEHTGLLITIVAVGAISFLSRSNMLMTKGSHRIYHQGIMASS